MGDVVRRGQKLYIRFKDVDGHRKMRLAPGATTKAEAKAQLARAESRVAQGLPGIMERPPVVETTPPADVLTVEQLGAKFLAGYHSPKVKDIADYRKEAGSVLRRRVYPTLGSRPAASITSLDVERLRDALVAEGYARASSTQVLAALSKMYQWGIKQGHVAANPVKGVERYRGEPSIDYLEKAEVAALLSHAEAHAPDVYPMIATAIYAGMRKGELFGLRWVDVNVERGQLTVARSYELAPKSGKRRHVAINPRLATILRAWKERCPRTDEGLVFPVDGVMGQSWDMLGLAELMKASGCHVPEKPWHALRHTFASHYMMAGGNILELQRILGHHSVTMTEIYSHFAPGHLAAGIARMSFDAPKPADVADLDEARAARAAGGA